MKKLSIVVLSLLFARQAYGLEQELKNLSESLNKLAGDLGGGGTPPPSPLSELPPPPPTYDEEVRLEDFRAKPNIDQKDIDAARKDLEYLEVNKAVVPQKLVEYRKLIDERESHLKSGEIPPPPTRDEEERLEKFAAQTDFTEQDINTARQDLQYVEKYDLGTPAKRAEYRKLIDERSKKFGKQGVQPSPASPGQVRKNLIASLEKFAAQTEFTEQELQKAREDLANLKVSGVDQPQLEKFRILIEKRSQKSGKQGAPPSTIQGEVPLPPSPLTGPKTYPGKLPPPPPSGELPPPVPHTGTQPNIPAVLPPPPPPLGSVTTEPTEPPDQGPAKPFTSLLLRQNLVNRKMKKRKDCGAQTFSQT